MQHNLIARPLGAYMLGIFVLNLAHPLLPPFFGVPGRLAMDIMAFTVGFGAAFLVRPAEYAKLGVYPAFALLISAGLCYLGMLAPLMYVYGYPVVLLPMVLSAALMVALVGICLPLSEIGPLLRRGVLLGLATAAASWVYCLAFIPAGMPAVLRVLVAALCGLAVWVGFSRQAAPQPR